ncbi:hypothetical protein Sipo8835_34025 [Streptomyces ipomoeae]|uniref:Uncharacterized protein n=1 Tax=Streptomyces ipomoeae TaxID=103232 RepID=A0AAE8VWM6_9ACTN|nr:hypothetical protein [Streptomyces ipomoeae]TQE24259.1 hypothetical protein Sipo8835_34025 [Streptomyces ipomoeae]
MTPGPSPATTPTSAHSLRTATGPPGDTGAEGRKGHDDEHRDQADDGYGDRNGNGNGDTTGVAGIARSTDAVRVRAGEAPDPAGGTLVPSNRTGPIGAPASADRTRIALDPGSRTLPLPFAPAPEGGIGGPGSGRCCSPWVGWRWRQGR